VIHVPGFEWDPRELLRACGLDVWEFHNLLGEQIPATARGIARSTSPIIDVSLGYEAYAAEQRRTSKKIFKSTLQKQRKLERDIGSTRFEFATNDRHAFDTLLQWKSQQYRRTGHRDRFAVKWVEGLVRELFDAACDGCLGTLSVLYGPDQVVAAHFGLRSETCLACWFPSYDATLRRYSPGLSLHLLMAQEAASAGLRYLDLGKGDEEYKQSLKTGDLTVGEGRFHQRSLGAVLQSAHRRPGQLATNFILSRPRLRSAVRRTLRRVGSLRTSA
jgi:CelD/BcsL family acetyltransferase involved in cellulose biosynthesis